MVWRNLFNRIIYTFISKAYLQQHNSMGMAITFFNRWSNDIRQCIKYNNEFWQCILFRK